MNKIINFYSKKNGVFIMSDITRERKIEIEKIVNGILIPYLTNRKTPNIDIVSLVKNDGFLVQRGDLPSETTGYLAVNDNEPVDKNNNTHRLIVVNDKFTNPDNEENVILKKSRFITAHEYGHYILHKKQDEPLYAHRDDDKRNTLQEKEADYFARSILMPAKIFLQVNKILDDILQGEIKEESIREKNKVEFLSIYFKVTKNKVLRRMEDIDILNSIYN